MTTPDNEIESAPLPTTSEEALLTQSTQPSDSGIEEKKKTDDDAAVAQPLGVTKLLMFFEGFAGFLLFIFLATSIYVDTFLFIPVVILIVVNLALVFFGGLYIAFRGPVTLGFMLGTRVVTGLVELTYGTHVQAKAYGSFCLESQKIFNCGTHDESQLHRFAVTWIFFLCAVYHLFIALLMLASSDHSEYDDLFTDEVTPQSTSRAEAARKGCLQEFVVREQFVAISPHVAPSTSGQAASTTLTSATLRCRAVGGQSEAGSEESREI
ncbi:hypothetical protein L596_024186 [Steinernema carpocapsae]|uniref:Uncharacterized protein n=1 Tax=Steinernema carpocapsae TaxID=34508 RepID=A0A4U5MFZ6_STECR|nr:hypothetical protein L596_024186 [Steinernema carpocapsae]